MHKGIKNKGGFTLIEMMVSVAIFAIVVTSGMGALTMILKSYRYSQSEKKSADSLSYVLENMTREIRLGHNYYAGSDLGGANSDDFKSGVIKLEEEGSLIGFQASDNRGYVIYHIKDNEIWKKFIREGGNTTDFSLTDKTQVVLNNTRVTVMNTDKEDMKQPIVWIQLSASVPGKDDNNVKVIQTLVSQRDLDI